MTPPINWLQVDFGENPPKLNSFSSCMTLSDVRTDSYVRLVAADIVVDEEEPNASLKVFRGIDLETEYKLNGLPSAVESLYADDSEPRTPIIAVAIAESVLFFRHLKPYFKYSLPEIAGEEMEKELWRKLAVVREEEYDEVLKRLSSMELIKLSRQSQKLLQLTAEERSAFIKKHADSPVVRVCNVVAMGCLRRVSSHSPPPANLVIAASNGDIVIIETQSFGLLYQGKTCSYETTPSLIAVNGTYEADFCIIVATRYGGVFLLRKHSTVGQEVFKMSEPLTGIVLLPIDQTIVVATVKEQLVCYSKKGKQLYQVTLPEFPTCMIAMVLEHLGITLVCVALNGGLVQFYMQKYLVDEFQMSNTIYAMNFGKMGMEEHVLSLITETGELVVKILRRTATFEPDKMLAFKLKTDKSNTNEPSILDKPKKSSIFIEQVQREKDTAKASYGNFQLELWRLRHKAAKATLEVINSSESTISGDITHAPVKLAAEVCGAGPEFRLYLTIQNLSTYKMASNMRVLFHADRRHYTIPKSFAKLPSILPGVPLKIDFEVLAVLDHFDKLPPHTLTPDNSHIRVMVLKANQTKPLIAAVIEMPQSEANFN